MKKFLPVFLLLVIFLTSCATAERENSPVLPVHTEAQARYLQGDYSLFTLYAKGTEELSKPEPVVLSPAPVELSEDSEFLSPVLLPSGEVSNLETGRTYWYRTADGKTGSFRTDPQPPRNLQVEGLTNVRDLGGWMTADGPTVQGLVFRSSKLNADESEEVLLTEEGRKALDSLGIRTEIDLRSTADNENGGITTSPLGEKVSYLSLPMESSGNCLTLNRALLPELFSILGNKENYPVLIHCSLGTDRTGMVAFLFNALLGVEEADLYRDYLFSNFALIGKMRTKTAVTNYLKAVTAEEGNSLSEKTRAYLLASGVPESDIDTFVSLMKKGL